MSETRIIVDHMKLDFSGLVDLPAMFAHIDRWLKDKGLEKRDDKTFEQMTPKGKFIEWQIASWKKLTDYTRFIIKVRMLIYGLKKVEAVSDNKKVTLSQGRILMYFDGFIEHDYEHRWEEKPLHFFFRTLYDKFIYKTYTERFEARLTFDVHHLYDELEKFLNMYRHYKVVSEVPHFAH